ncbi:hypothetical protein ACFFP0_20450 [Rhizobium puerariae]|uniref:Uncharacterized protein n=1 Tax=Rhizobium puerariae TaxID=1585791 RepID=A0ABV6AKT7_9HYPH
MSKRASSLRTLRATARRRPRKPFKKQSKPRIEDTDANRESAVIYVLFPRKQAEVADKCKVPAC